MSECIRDCGHWQPCNCRWDDGELLKAREAITRYIVAQGPHLSDSWRDFLIDECGLHVDAIGCVYAEKPKEKR